MENSRKRMVPSELKKVDVFTMLMRLVDNPPPIKDSFFVIDGCECGKVPDYVMIRIVPVDLVKNNIIIRFLCKDCYKGVT